VTATWSRHVGAGVLDLALREVVLPEGARVALSAREFELLRLLAARPSSVHSRVELRRRSSTRRRLPPL
jgi:two-component system response regulator QseB